MLSSAAAEGETSGEAPPSGGIYYEYFWSTSETKAGGIEVRNTVCLPVYIGGWFASPGSACLLLMLRSEWRSGIFLIRPINIFGILGWCGLDFNPDPTDPKHQLQGYSQQTFRPKLFPLVLRRFQIKRASSLYTEWQIGLDVIENLIGEWGWYWWR